MIWFVAIPLLDCIGLIFSRVRKGMSWTSAGRDHIHHRLMKNFSQEGTLLIILIITLITGIFGIYIENIASASISLTLFIIYSLIYFTVASFYKENI